MSRLMVGCAVITFMFCGCAQKTNEQVLSAPKISNQCTIECEKSLKLGEIYRPIL